MNKNATENSLDGLRAFAIFSVIVFHFSLGNDFLRLFSLNNPFFSGVELFFLISGYGITASLLKENYSLKKFVKNRITKIYPGIITLLMICLAINYFLGLVVLPEFAVTNFVRTQPIQIIDSIKILTATYVFSNSGTYAFSALWYLSIQLQFYAIMVIVSVIARNKSQRYWILLVISTIFACFCMISRFWIGCGNEVANEAVKYILGWKFDMPFYGILLYFFVNSKYAKKLKDSKRNAKIISALALATPIITLMFTGSHLENGRWLTGLGYPICVAGYGTAVLLAVTNFELCIPNNGKIVSWLSSRSYSLFLYNFLGLEVAWFFIAKFCSWTFYTGEFVHYGVAQFILGGGYLPVF